MSERIDDFQRHLAAFKVGQAWRQKINADIVAKNRMCVSDLQLSACATVLRPLPSSSLSLPCSSSSIRPTDLCIPQKLKAWDHDKWDRHFLCQACGEPAPDDEWLCRTCPVVFHFHCLPPKHEAEVCPMCDHEFEEGSAIFNDERQRKLKEWVPAP